MSGHTEHWVECDICHTATVYHVSLLAARNEARRNGWIQRKQGVSMIDVCPQCQRVQTIPRDGNITEVGFITNP